VSIARGDAATTPVRRLAIDGVVVAAAGRSDVHARLPSTTARDKAPAEVVAFARDAIEHGWQVRVRRTWPRLIARLACGVAVWIGCVYLLSRSVTGPGAVALAAAMLAGVLFVLGTALPAPGFAGRLRGRPVAGAGRASTGLWRMAVADVVAATRSEAELPALHRSLVAVANAEDKVSRLARRNRYDVDQSEVELARHELASLVNRVRDDLGQPPLEPAPTPYLASRWSDDAGVDQPEPTRPEDLR
jgi:hypothetical protein